MIDGHFGTRLKWGLLVVASLREWAERQVIAFLDRVYAPRIIAEVMRQAQPAIATEVMRQAQSAEQRHLTQSFHVWMARSPGDILSDWEIECFAAASSSSKGDPATAEDVRQSLQGTSIPLLEKIIADVGSVLDVGVAVGNFMHVMAKAHADVKFIGVDFWSNLLELNEPLLLPNFTVKQGYALPMIEAGLTADVVHFCSTATRIKENELLGDIFANSLNTSSSMSHFLGCRMARSQTPTHTECRCRSWCIRSTRGIDMADSHRVYATTTGPCLKRPRSRYCTTKS